MRFRPLWIVAALALVGVASPQGDDGQADAKPWMLVKANLKKRVKLNFSGSGVDAVVHFFSIASGVAIVKDPGLTGSLSLSTPAAIPLSDAFGIFAASLDLKGFQLQKQDTFLVIKAKAKPATTGRGPMGTSPFSMGAGGPMQGGGRQTTELRTYSLKYASASSVAKTINDAFSQSNSSTFGGFAGGFPTGGPGGGGGPGGQGGPGGDFGPGGFQRQASTGSNSQGTVKASSDEYSNTVIVNAPASLQLQVSDLIRRIDVEVKQPLVTKMYPLKYASAADLTTPIQNVLTANSPKGRGATTQTTTPFPFGFGSQSNSNQGAVTYDTRSNALIVMTTDQNQAIVADLLTGLDKEIVSADASAVIALSNARATDMATLLNQAFGSRSGSRTTASTSNTSRTSSSSSSSRSNSNGLGNLPGSAEHDGNLYVEMRDPGADSGELATQVSVQQGLPQFGQPQGGSSSSQSKTSVSRDAQGRIVNTTDLTNRVTVVADSNTNSLIVVGDPDAVARLQAIIDQLDRIPEQVVIETMIVEASLDAESKLGVEWSFAQAKAFGNTGTEGVGGTSFGLQPSTGTNGGFSYTLRGGNLSAYLNAFKSDQRFQVLSTPRIFTSNNVQATINISQAIPYVTSSREDTSGALTYNYQFQDVGIVLTVTPQISPSGMVTLDVTQTANELQSYTSFNAPIVSQREATTTVSVKDGETVVLGGIMRKTVSTTTKKVPILGDIPLLGQIFRSTSKSDTKTELLVLLTPRIVRNPDDAKAISERQKKELSPEIRKQIGGYE
ncbi:MAG TPA: secretin N-terminal domain-containing protein [Fimbriimonadaceae bacterium]|nr:secretin N-terminal domain-containing protein [Fimbriimonadaceae bacterium]